MFGFKIIKETEYQKLLSAKKDFLARENHLREDNYKLAKDNESLREQLNKMIMDVRRKTELKYPF